LDNPTFSLAPKLTDEKTAFPGHMSSNMPDLVSAVAGAESLVRLRAASSEAISALVKVGAFLVAFCLESVAGLSEPFRADPRGDVGLMILIGDRAPFLRFVGRVGDDGLLASERPWTEMLSGVYFRVLMAPVWSRVDTMAAGYS
jgi:hypothetical protein